MGHLYYDFLKRNCDYNQSSKIEVDTLKVYIVGVDTGSPSGLLASPYMEKELNLKKMKHQPITVSSDKSIGDAGRQDGYGFGQGDRIASCA